MQVVSEQVAIPLKKGLSVLEAVETFFQDSLKPNEHILRFFVVKADKKRVLVEVSFLRS